MHLKSTFGILLVAGWLQAVAAMNADTMWLVKDTTGDIMWMQMYCADTFPDNRGQFKMADTGDSYNGSHYVNFNYQFTDASPGYAGFKLYWDDGVMSFYAADYDSMVFWHKGPLPGHKVVMIWGQGSAGCGTPIFYEKMGEFKASSTWKRESLTFPEGFKKNGLFELRMLVYNDSAAGTVSPTSPKGNLKIDNMFFIKKSSAVLNPALAPKVAAGSRYFIPSVSGKVTLAVFSLQGEQLFKAPVDVSAGKKYDVNQFAQINSNLPSGWIHCVKITGAGVNITRKLFK
jgi:hypothetical protein